MKYVDLNEIEDEEDYIAVTPTKKGKETAIQQTQSAETYITKVNGSVIIRLG